MKNKSTFIIILITSLLLVLILSIGGFVLLSEKKSISEDSVISEDQDIEVNFRNILEKEYPDFKDFENQTSFAGKKVKMEIQEGDRYYAYMVLGSGIPVVEATCFKIDSMGRVFKTGIFPDPTDSYLGYSDINPKTCRGIK